MTPKEQLEDAQLKPHNRKYRRMLAKHYKINWKIASRTFKPGETIDLGIKNFKKLSTDHETIKTFKENAWHSNREQTTRLRRKSKVSKLSRGASQLKIETDK